MKRSWVYRKNDETGEVESIEITGPVEWINGGCRYGSETLEKMRKEGLVPPETFTDRWAAQQSERDRVSRLATGDVSAVKNDAKAEQRKRELYQRMSNYRGEDYRDAAYRRRRG